MRTAMHARLRPHLIALIALGLPLIGSHLARMAIGVSDTVIVGRYGVDALAALVLATSTQFVLYMLGSGFAIGLMGVLPSALARGDGTEVRRATRMALWLSFMHAALIVPPLWFSDPLLVALGQKPEVAALAQSFLRIACWGVAAMLGQMVLNSYLAALGRAGVVLWVLLAGLPVNVALNIALVFGKFGLPEMGVAGSALASLIVQVVQLAVLWAYALWLPKARVYRLGHRLWRPDWPAFRQVFRLGLPIGLTLVAEVGMFTAVNLMMGWIGTIELAAHGIALQLSGLAFMVHLGLSNAATIRVGNAAGRGSRQDIADGALAAILLSIVIATLAALVFLAFPRALVSLYLDPADPRTPEIVAVAVTLMFWAAMFQLADAMQAIALGLLRGVLDTRAPALIAGFSYWLIGLPAGYVAAFVLGFGAQGLWMGLLVGLLAAAILLMRRFWAGRTRGDWTRAMATA